jgi:hypothetical protein
MTAQVANRHTQATFMQHLQHVREMATVFGISMNEQHLRLWRSMLKSTQKQIAAVNRTETKLRAVQRTLLKGS